MIQEYLRVPASTLIEAANQTIYMVAVSLVAGAILGMLIAIVLVLTRERGPLENKWVFNILGVFPPIPPA